MAVKLRLPVLLVLSPNHLHCFFGIYFSLLLPLVFWRGSLGGKRMGHRRGVGIALLEIHRGQQNADFQVQGRTGKSPKQFVDNVK